MTSSELASSEAKQQTQTSAPNQTMLFLLKVAESLFLTAFICSSVLAILVPSDPKIASSIAISIAGFIFFFLLNRQVVKYANNEFDLKRKAELYLASTNPSANNSLAPAREKALQYCQELIDDYKRTRSQSRNLYYTLQLSTIFFSGVTPILVLVDKLEAGQNWLKWLPVICPAIASIVASIVTSFPFQENWISANTTVELLEAEQEKFVLGVTPLYRSYDSSDPAEEDQKAKQAIENFIVQVNNIHLKQLQESKNTTEQEEQSEKYS